jgi:hypothetical protein
MRHHMHRIKSGVSRNVDPESLPQQPDAMQETHSAVPYQLRERFNAACCRRWIGGTD